MHSLALRHEHVLHNQLEVGHHDGHGAAREERKQEREGQRQREERNNGERNDTGETARKRAEGGRVWSKREA